MKKYKYGNHKSLVIYSASMALLAMMGGVSMYVMRLVIDNATEGNLSYLITITKYLSVFLFLEFAVKRFVTRQKEAYLKISQKELKTAYVKKLFNLDLLSLSNQDEQVYLSQLSNDMDRYSEKFYLNLIYLIEIVLQLLVTLLILTTLDIKLLFLALFLLIIFTKMAQSSSKPIIKQESKKSSALKNYTRYIKETLDGFIVIKQNLLQSKSQDNFECYARAVQNDNYNLDKKTSQVDAFNSLLQFSLLLLLIFSGVFFAKSQSLSLGTTLLAGTAFANTLWPMQQISPMITQMRGVGAIIEGFEKTLSQDKSDECQQLLSFDSLQFHEVSLSYDDMLVLENINILINQGDKVLIIGESGSGKSTLLKSIRRQLRPKLGKIYCNNLPINQIYALDYFNQFAIVDQVGFIFNGTLQDNISLYSMVDNNQLTLILEEVGLANMSKSTMLVNDGANLSGGQRARLLLARALYLDSNVIICDEILASLDANIAQEIERDMLELNKTLINVSHIYFDTNLSSYDKIYEVNSGKIKQVSVDHVKNLKK